MTDATQSINVRKFVGEGNHQGRPFRKYSDGTYKAASSQGWIEFPNFDELVRYHSARKLKRALRKADQKSGLLGSLKNLIR